MGNFDCNFWDFYWERKNHVADFSQVNFRAKTGVFEAEKPQKVIK